MRWNPFVNALAALAYIATLVTFMHRIETLRHDTPDTMIDGLGVISLFVFSAAVMAFLFFYRPVSLLIEGKKDDALSFFLSMLATFGAVTLAVLIMVFLQ